MMLPRTYEGQTCSIARALEIVGERWTLLLLRDALLGVRRFEDFRAALRIPRNVLAVRLDLLVKAGLLRREPYSDHPVRHEYVPTDRALDLWPVLLALRQWGARHGDPAGVTREFPRVESGKPVHATR
jgi:DNA-binding HxlR family transcriptional regulator